MSQWLAVGVGAALGAWARWGLGLMLNAALPSLALGTLAANLIGAYIMGIAISLFALAPHVASEMRLFIMTGLLGGMTTFSTFSAEGVQLISRGQYGWATTHVLLHVFGSLLMTGIGIFTIEVLKG